jgi:hypothetical protein
LCYRESPEKTRANRELKGQNIGNSRGKEKTKAKNPRKNLWFYDVFTIAKTSENKTIYE